MKNSSPVFYGDAILIRNSYELHVVIDKTIFPAQEFQINERVFRYLALENIVYLPIIQREGRWGFESKNTPAVSDTLIDFLSDNNVKIRLIRKEIKHSDVGPMTSAKSFQFDKDHNRFLKINNGYYRVKQDKFGSMYINGDYDILPLKETDGRFYINSHISHGQYSCHKEVLQKPNLFSNHKNYYFDNSVLQAVSGEQLLKNAKPFLDVYLSLESKFSASSDIDSAFFINDNDYFLYQDKMLVVKQLGGDYYTFLDDINSEGNIYLYKNKKSNTYYLLKKNEYKKKWKYNIRNSHCKVKRQIPSGCMNTYCETPELSTLLKRNIHNGFRILNADKKLELYSGIDGFYRSKNDMRSLYYLSSDDVYFHVSEVDNIEERVTPVYFKIYGKNKNEEINHDFLISDICILKDFYDKKTIVRTPIEAQEIALGLDKAYSQKLLRWQQHSSEGMVVERGSAEIEQLSQRLSNPFNVDEVKKIT
ncbi:MAG: hypothetical protein ACMZI0_11805 [Symbiopectobacterium sp.]|uniref:hypothetical protein n=1 Tax=Symbiopectobacterium sp. TaxID=2952789 RepID=UPI0039EAD9DC